MAKSLRTAFIRVTGKNYTSAGEVMYTKTDISTILKDWADSSKLKYWFIEHNNDQKDDSGVDHFHIVIKFTTPVPFINIKNKFPYGKIESARSLRNAVQYLLHLNDQSKKQYNVDEVETNDKQTLDEYLSQTSENESLTLVEILEGIKTGRIREFNQWEKIPQESWVKYRQKIENAHIHFKEKIFMDKDRQIQGIFISGPTGTGKTTWVKSYCKKLNKSLAISSSSNDVMQDYKGEDVLLLDDLRDKNFEFNDLLKILDNHTKSTTKSRYHNKFFVGDTIVITSPDPLDTWYFLESPESKQQLKRRLQFQYQFEDDFITEFRYNDQYKRYEKTATYVNNVKNNVGDADSRKGIAGEMGMEVVNPQQYGSLL
jgi:hypothetical protein